MGVIDLIAANNFIVYNKYIAAKLGAEATIVLGHLSSIQLMLKKEEFTDTEDDICKQTSLTRYSVRQAKNELQERGILIITRKGMPAQDFIKIDEQKISDLINNNTPNSDNKLSENEQPVVRIQTTRDANSDNIYNIPNNTKDILYNKKAYKNTHKNDAPATIAKNTYGKNSNVLLTEEEYNKLLSTEKGAEAGKAAIEYLSIYKAEKGYKTKSDYLTILRWVFSAVEERDLKNAELERRKERLTGQAPLKPEQDKFITEKNKDWGTIV